MSSTERAPEPTMEEILASIRRIISDDESNSAQQRSAAPQSQDDDEALELSEGEPEVEADDKIINDIARVLSGGAPTPVEAVEEKEDILDLTAELGGLEPVEEDTQTVEVLAEAEALAPEPEFEPEFQEPETEPAPEPVAEEVREPEVASPEAEQVAEQPAETAQVMSASEEAASALERAIAALRAGQLPTSPIFSYEPPPFTPQAEPEFAAQAEATPEQVAEPAPVSEPAYEAEGEPEFTLTEFEAEMVAQEPAILEVVVSEPEPEPEVERSWDSATDRGWEPGAPSWAAREQAQSEPEYPAQRTNGGNHQTYAAAGGEAGPKSLEDSVKDMLRPMLQCWLDENMSRVLTAALKDELRDNPARFDTD
jgi:uncharacterized protein